MFARQVILSARRLCKRAGWLALAALLLASCSPAPFEQPRLVTVSLSASSLTVETGTTQSIAVTGADGAVLWSVDGVSGGNASVGTITAAGLYTAPASPPSPNRVRVTATVRADPRQSAALELRIVNPAPHLDALTPASLPAGAADATLLLTGQGFALQSVVRLGETALATTFLGANQLQATLPAEFAAEAETLAVSVVTPAPGGGRAGPLTLRVIPAVSISPPNVAVFPGHSQQLRATVSGTADARVVWSLDGAPAAASDAARLGAVSPDGVYTAPATVPDPPRVRLRATSAADPESSATATIYFASIQEDWPKYRRDLANSGRSGEAGIDSGNVVRLSVAWTFSTGSGGTVRISASPAVATVNSVRRVYFGNWTGRFFAVNADTGVESWHFDVDRNVGSTCPTGGRCRIGSSAAVANGKVYFGAENGFLYALNADTGALVWKASLGDPDQGAEVWSSPAVWNGVVYVGLASHNSAPCVAGKVFAFDAATGGAPLWTFNAIDQATCPSGTCLGAGVWSSPAIDTTFGILYVGTGNAGRGCVPSTANATDYPDGLLVLDATTGAFKSFHQTFPNDVNDEGDIGASPALHDTEVNDQCAASDTISHWVTVASKDSVVHTAPRNSTGLAANPADIVLNAGEALASAAVIPVTTTQSCGSGNLITTANEIFQPTAGGYVFKIGQQSADGSTALDWQLLVKLCDPANPCPLFSAPATINDIMIFGGGEGNIYAATTADPKILWSFGTFGLVASGPAISHDMVYFGSFDGTLYALAVSSANPIPKLDSLLAPSSLPAAAGGFTLTVRGLQFIAGAVVKWNGAARTTTFVDSTQLTAFIPASDIASGSSASITVTNPSPGGGTSAPLTFDYAAP